jgi:hypothetical protein
MMIRNVLFLLILLLAGCVDTIDTVTREYRNTNNEAIDAMMMITSEAQAKRMTIRVFKPLTDRYKEIDKRLDAVQANRSKKEFVKEVCESNGTHLYLTELEVNRQRFSLEFIRLKHLMKAYVDRERELLIAGGDANPQINERELCPTLATMLTSDQSLGPVRAQLKSPKLLDVMSTFPSYKLQEYEKAFDVFLKKREIFALKKEIILVD